MDRANTDQILHKVCHGWASSMQTPSENWDTRQRGSYRPSAGQIEFWSKINVKVYLPP
jgi:hypothetical protein